MQVLSRLLSTIAGTVSRLTALKLVSWNSNLCKQTDGVKHNLHRFNINGVDLMQEGRTHSWLAVEIPHFLEVASGSVIDFT